MILTAIKYILKYFQKTDEMSIKDIQDSLDNLEKITSFSNIKAFDNLDQIFIYDIEDGYQNVDKNNHFHIFEKEITYNFTKNS